MHLKTESAVFFELVPKTNLLELAYLDLYIFRAQNFIIAVTETKQVTRFDRETELNFSTMTKTKLNLLAMHRVQMFCD